MNTLSTIKSNIYNKRTVATIPPTDSLIVWYKFNTIDVSNGGTSLFNYANSTYDTVTTGADMIVANTATPKNGTGSFYKLSSGAGSVSRVEGVISSVMTSTQPLTIAFWYKALAMNPAFSPVFQSRFGTTNQHLTSFRINGLGTSFAVQFNSSGGSFVPTALPSGITNVNDTVNWYYVAFVMSGTTITFYINNQQAGTPVSYTSFVAGTYNQTSVGVDWNNVDNAGGAKFELDDLRCYTRVLTTAELTLLYNYGS
jgi:hypothetical protein